jgi:branched-chain amino acid transport system substrate-binding protein
MGLDVPIFAVANTRFEQVIKVAGDAAANFYATEYTALPDEKNVPAVANLMSMWKKKNPSADMVPDRYYILSHVNAIIMVEAMKRCGKDLTRKRFVETLESMKNFDTGGITGKITYSEKDHCPLSAMRLVKANPASLRYEPATDWGLPKLSSR